ncbi:MAG: 30S ribosomal protein S14 [Desulfurococcaceae archaeon]
MGKYKPPNTYKHGKGAKACARCGARDAVIQAYGLYLCRQCFRELATSMGFKKYS